MTGEVFAYSLISLYEGNQLNLKFRNGHFIMDCNIIDASLAKRAGFGYSRKHKVWATPYASVAKRVSSLASKETQFLIDRKLAVEKAVVADSGARWSSFQPPVPSGQELMPFQRAGVEFMVERANCLQADEMGTGKTPQTLVAMNYLHSKKIIKNSLIICPASLKLNWLREFAAWDTTGMSCDIAYGSKFPKSDIVIANYDIMAKITKETHAKVWDNVVMEECHYVKNNKARRTKEVVGGYMFTEPDPETLKRRRLVLPPIKAKRKIMISGTPIVNRPIELFTALNYINPYGFPNKHKFGMRYCRGHRGGFGWDYKGASNLAELQFKLRSTIMIRRLKSEVLPQLPRKIRQIIELDPNTKKYKTVKRASDNLFARILNKCGVKSINDVTEDNYEDVVKMLDAGEKIDFSEASRIRREQALEKLPLAINFLKDAVGNSGKVVCFCWHREVVEQIAKTFGRSCVAVYGNTTIKARDKHVEDFQNNEDIELFVGNIKAAGVGITLTASSHVVFVEQDWVPGNVTQAEDRTHRMGQLDTVLVQHLVIAGTNDVNMLKVMIHKQEVLDATMETDYDEVSEEMLS